jgi:Uncharacterized protein conserved in bacteria (DUF2188)
MQAEVIGDYVIELPHPRAFWVVRRFGATEALSQHNTKAEAKAAVRRYQRGDKRRHHRPRSPIFTQDA